MANSEREIFPPDLGLRERAGAEETVAVGHRPAPHDKGVEHGKDAPLLKVSYIAHQVIDEHDLPGVPPFVKRLLFGALARMAVLLGKTRDITPPSAAAPGGRLG